MGSGIEGPVSGGDSYSADPSAATRSRVNRWSAIIVAGVLVGVGSIFFNVMPLILSSIAKARGLTDSQVGLFASFGMGGALVATLASVLWIRRISWKLLSMAAALVAATGFAGLMVVGNYAGMLALGFLAGCGQAGMVAPAIAMISDTEVPSRNFALMVGLQVAVASVLAAVFPAIEGAWSFAGVMGVLTAITLACAGLALALPAKGTRSEVQPEASGEGKGAASHVPVFLSIGGLLIFYTGITAVWGFAGILGEAWGLNQGQVATAVSVSLGAGLVGALVAGLLADRVRALSAILFGVLGLVATYALLGFQGSYLSFLFLLLAMNCFWNVCVAYQAAMVASFDATGRFTILMTAGQTAGAILGPGLMGLILDSTEGFIIGLGFASVWLIASYAMFWKAGRLGDIPSWAD